MVVFFQYGHVIFLESALRLVGEGMGWSYTEWKARAADRDPLWRIFHDVSDACEARFRCNPAGDCLGEARTVLLGRPDVAQVPDFLDPVPWEQTYGVAAVLEPGVEVPWYDAGGVEPRAFPVLRLAVVPDRFGEAMVFLYGCPAEGPEQGGGGTWYRIVADPWVDHPAETAAFMAALLDGTARVGATEPADLHLDLLDAALAAARP